MSAMTQPMHGSEGRGRRLARAVAVLTGLLGVGELIRWGNRWYVATQYPDDATYSATLEVGAHQALVTALVLLLVAAGAAVIGWRLRVTRAR